MSASQLELPIDKSRGFTPLFGSYTMLKDKIIFGILMLPMVASFASDEHGWNLKDPNSGYHQKMPADTPHR